ncbi:zinc-binding dehydrogenase [Phaeobacter sp. 22II1-1F12B]|uniref:zinc-binding dehydrogenase n=1 Tax=Phaeobacter sp. 22II1-1F12B TaxID=1317111 RepID=UPI001303ADCE|nr:zinc-binding dehydrogenase [Phaeobacter sp. 22II1-1F12B]
MSLRRGGLSILGSPAAIAVTRDPSIRTERLAKILQWASEGKIAPYVSHRFPLEETREAMTALWKGEVSGACILHP